MFFDPVTLATCSHICLVSLQSQICSLMNYSPKTKATIQSSERNPLGLGYNLAIFDPKVHNLETYECGSLSDLRFVIQKLPNGCKVNISLLSDSHAIIICEMLRELPLRIIDLARLEARSRKSAPLSDLHTALFFHDKVIEILQVPQKLLGQVVEIEITQSIHPNDMLEILDKVKWNTGVSKRLRVALESNHSLILHKSFFDTLCERCKSSPFREIFIWSNQFNEIWTESYPLRHTETMADLMKGCPVIPHDCIILLVKSTLTKVNAFSHGGLIVFTPTVSDYKTWKRTMKIKLRLCKSSNSQFAQLPNELRRILTELLF